MSLMFGVMYGRSSTKAWPVRGLYPQCCRRSRINLFYLLYYLWVVKHGCEQSELGLVLALYRSTMLPSGWCTCMHLWHSESDCEFFS